MNNILDNKDIINNINEIENKINNLIQSDNYDKNEIIKLRMQQLMAGLPLNIGIKKGKTY